MIRRLKRYDLTDTRGDGEGYDFKRYLAGRESGAGTGSGGEKCIGGIIFVSGSSCTDLAPVCPLVL